MQSELSGLTKVSKRSDLTTVLRPRSTLIPKTLMPTKRLSADVVTAKAFVLVDDSNRERCVIETSPTGESGMVILNLLDSHGRPRIALQVDPDGNPSIALFTEGNLPAISLAVNERGNGVGVANADGVPCIEVGVPNRHANHPSGDQPVVNIRDQCGRLLWSTATLS